MTRVLVVEDIPDFAMNVERQLAASDPEWEVRAVFSADEAAVVIDNGFVPDCALVDLDLGRGPDESGLDVLAVLDELPGRPTRTVIHTADVEANRWLLVVASTYRFDPDGYVSKSARSGAVSAAIRDVLAGRRTAPRGVDPAVLDWFDRLLGDDDDRRAWAVLSAGTRSRQQLADETFVAVRTAARFLADKAELVERTPLPGRAALAGPIALASHEDDGGRPAHLLAVSSLATSHPLVFRSRHFGPGAPGRRSSDARGGTKEPRR